MMQVLSVSMGRPPRGGRGLKFYVDGIRGKTEKSPSTRRAWIEIIKYGAGLVNSNVALHAEGVD